MKEPLNQLPCADCNHMQSILLFCLLHSIIHRSFLVHSTLFFLQILLNHFFPGLMVGGENKNKAQISCLFELSFAKTKDSHLAPLLPPHLVLLVDVCKVSIKSGQALQHVLQHVVRISLFFLLPDLDLNLASFLSIF